MHLGCRKAHGQRNLQSSLTLATHHILRPCIIMNMQARLSRTSKSSTMQLSNRPPTRSSSAQNHMQSRQISSVHSRQAGQQHFRSQITFGRRLGSFRQRTGPATSALFGHTVAENSFVVNGDIEKVFEYAADFSHINRWDPGTEESNNMESSKRAALMEGDKIAMSTVLLGTTTPTVYMVLELNAPQKVVFFGVSRFHENKDTVTFKKGPKEGQTIVTYVSDIWLIRWFKYFQPVCGILMAKLAKEAVDGLEKKLKQLEPQLTADRRTLQANSVG